MIDTRRWVLCEAWLSLGFRVRFAKSYEANELREHFLADDETNGSYLYLGDREWVVALPNAGSYRIGQSPPVAPQLGTETMRHELVHYLLANEDARHQRNFGLPRDGDRGGPGDQKESEVLTAEAAVDALMNACANVVASALNGARR